MLPSRLLVTEHFPIAICALSPLSNPSYLTYPSPVPSPSSVSQNPTTPTPTSTQSQSGDVILSSTCMLTLSNVIHAHKAPISFLTLNSTGMLLATAFEKGMVIWVWSVPGTEKLYQFCHGTHEMWIYSISFNTTSTLLTMSSVHDHPWSTHWRHCTCPAASVHIGMSLWHCLSRLKPLAPNSMKHSSQSRVTCRVNPLTQLDAC